MLVVGTAIAVNLLEFGLAVGAGALVVGAILVGTASVRTCPLYRLFGIRTCPAQ